MYTIERIHIWTAIIRNSRSVFKNYLTVLSKYAVYKRLDPRKPIKKLADAGFRATVMPPWTIMDGLPIGFIHAER